MAKLTLRASLLLLACARANAGALFLARRGPPRTRVDKQYCAELVNHGAYFSVDVEVGTPGQKFSVVADTGSNTLIVPSCVCQQAGHCPKQDRCFTGTNKSSTFVLLRESGRPVSMVISFGSGQVQGVVARDRVKVGGLSTYMKEGLMLMTAKALNFGGSFEGILGLGIPDDKDVHHRQPQARQPGGVRPDDASKIIDWIKRIIGQRSGLPPTGAIPMGGAPTGSVPMGGMPRGGSPMGGAPMGGAPMGGAPAGGAPVGGAPMGGAQTGGAAAGPEPPAFEAVWEDGQQLPPMGWAPMGDMPMGGMPMGGMPMGGMPMGGMPMGGTPMGGGGQPLPKIHTRQPPSFLEQAGVTSFGICFNEGSSGVLRLGMPTDQSVPVHTSVGVYHWGLGLDGISVADGQGQAMRVKLCSRKHMRPGQETACGAIPDSGTTMITGPAKGIGQLLDSLCDRWPRCRANHTALKKAAEAAEGAAAKVYGFNPFNLQSAAKRKVLKFLLNDCESWLDKSVGLAEMPSLHFHIAGANGTRQTLEMPASAYVLEKIMPKNASGPKGAAFRKAWLNMTHGRSKVCTPAFSVVEYDTAKNGPVWILGQPFFYEFNVGYDLSTKPPSLSLKPTRDAPCGSCDGRVGLVSEAAEVHGRGTAVRRHRPRPLDGEPRAPSLDVGVPL